MGATELADGAWEAVVEDRENRVKIDVLTGSGGDDGASFAGGKSSIKDTSSKDEVEILRCDKGDLTADILPVSASSEVLS